jgi:hypothetical protein
MVKVISFSLWGDNPKYCVGAIKNAQLYKQIYPDWRCRFYVSDKVNINIIKQLEKYDSEIILKSENANWTGMFWRFECGFDESVDISIFRDTDSRLNLREKYAVDDWLISNKTFHIMRDHPCHAFPILGGMWGIKNKQFSKLKYLMDNFETQDEYGTDYKFFIQKLYPLINDDKIVHDEFFDKIPFPQKRQEYEFVGEVFDCNDIRNEEHRNLLINHLS